MSFSEVDRRLYALFNKIGYPDSAGISLSEGTPFVEVYHYGVQIKIQWPNWRISGGSRGGTLHHLDEEKTPRMMPCNRPFREFTIYFDGTVTPCCEVFHDGGDTKVVVDRLIGDSETSIFDIYSSRYLSKFRQSVFGYEEKRGVCKYCHFNDTSDGTDVELRQQILKNLEGPKWMTLHNNFEQNNKRFSKM